MTTKDINIRIEKSVHRRLKITSAKYGISIKDLIGIMAVNKGFEHTLSALQEGK